MRNRMLEEALATSPASSLKAGCTRCDKRHLCHRLVDALADIGKFQVNVWDLEYKIRIKAITGELTKLGFEFPDSMRYCEINKMTHREAANFLREAQKLLIEMKNHEEGKD